MKQRPQKTICYILLFTGLGFLYYKWYQGTGFAVPCFFHAITKLYCPGCGMTRCLTHLLQFEIQDAFRCNVAIFLLSPALLYILTYSLYSYVRYGKVHFSKVQNILFAISRRFLFYNQFKIKNFQILFFLNKAFSYCPEK